MKANFLRIKFSRYLLWQFGLVVFLLTFVIVLFLNLCCFWNTENDLSDGAVDVGSALKVVDRTSFDYAMSVLKERKEIFQDSLLKSPRVKDPSI